MPNRSSDRTESKALVALTGIVIGVVVVASLYWVQVIFIPLAMAVLLTFILNPLVKLLQKGGLGRAPSVVLVVTTAIAFIGLGSWIMARQVTEFVEGLPDYQANIQAKIQFLKELTPGTGRLQEMFDELSRQWKTNAAGAPGTSGQSPEQAPSADAAAAPVVVNPVGSPWVTQLPRYLNVAVVSLSGIVFVLILTVFMLLKREDLRSRFLRLAGVEHLSTTTKALDEAFRRISRFLLMQMLINGTYGVVLAIGLALIGVKHAAFWGIMMAVLRYVPYLGAWVVGVLLIVLTIAMSDGWMQPLLVLALFVTLEAIASNVAEPMLFGKTLGVSEVALLVAAAFWAFLWGPIGLVLSGPLTVSLVVLGKFVPQLKFFDVLLSDRPMLPPATRYYQRLIARDQDEAVALALDQVKGEAPEKVYDSLLVPALIFARRDRARDELTAADEQFIQKVTRSVLEGMSERGSTAPEKSLEEKAFPKQQILACPGRDQSDTLALEMFRKLLDPAHWEVEVLPAQTSIAEIIERADTMQPAVVCIGALPPGGLSRANHLCKRLRLEIPSSRIMVGRWGLHESVDQNWEELKVAGADVVETNLVEARDNLNDWLSVFAPVETKNNKLRAKELSRTPA